MISNDCLSIEWINTVSVKNNKADKILVEKVIRALRLLEGLAEAQLKFVFKGGTSLMLLFDSTKRLSIDIDIIMENKIELEKYFDEIVKNKGFTRQKLQERNSIIHIEKTHYKFFYKPVYKTSQSEEYILLDILFEKPLYNKLIELPIDSTFVKQDSPTLKVKTPDFDNILGDKLTAFAPETAGIPYERNGQSMAMEIMKQLYDIGSLFDHCSDVKAIKEAFSDFAIHQLKIRELGDDKSIVLDDIYDSALTICTRGKDGGANFDKLQQGIRQVNPFIFSENYHIEKAIVDASKAAYLATLIRHNNTEFEKFSSPMQIKNWIIEQPLKTRLNKLKKSNPEAFFYWYKIFEIEKIKPQS